MSSQHQQQQQQHPSQLINDRLQKLEALVGASSSVDKHGAPSSSSSSNVLEARIVALESGLASITTSSGGGGSDANPSSSSARQDLLNIWIEIADLQRQAGIDETDMILNPTSSSSSSSSSEGDDPFKSEFVRSVTPQLSEISSSLASISALLSSNSALIDSPSYTITPATSTRLQSAVDSSNDVLARTSALKYKVDALINNYEKVMEDCNTLFVVVDERMGEKE
jgi:hypothetical protein